MTITVFVLALLTLVFAAWHTHALIEKIPAIIAFLTLIVMAWLTYSRDRLAYQFSGKRRPVNLRRRPSVHPGAVRSRAGSERGKSAKDRA